MKLHDMWAFRMAWAVAAAGLLTGSAQSPAVAQDWPMLGGSPARNMVADFPGIELDFDLTKGRNVVWQQVIGTQSYGVPVVAGDVVLLGSNNGATRLPHVTGDKGVLLCFDQESGQLRWQLSRDKLESGSANDWPEQGIGSTPAVEGNRAWLVTNRCELVCLDLPGFADGENDGPWQEETLQGPQDADIVWLLDMAGELNVFPRYLAVSSPVILGDRVFLVTGNGTGPDEDLPSPDAPSFLAVDKNTGAVIWALDLPGKGILDGQWGSPAVGVVRGAPQVCFPGGDGWLYAVRPEDGSLIWKFDCNPKAAQWGSGGTGDRNYLIATPVYAGDSVLVATGRDPESGHGTGWLWRIDATRTGDISPELGEPGQPGQPNPDSGAIWGYGGIDESGEITGEAGEPVFHRSISTVAVANDLVLATDLSGIVHCVDFATGRRCWVHDMVADVWGSPMVADGKLFVGNLDGKLVVLGAGREGPEVLGEFDTDRYAGVYSTPVFAGGHLWLADMRQLYKIRVRPPKKAE